MDKHMYIGLLRADGTEPPAESGYSRVPATDASQIVFHEAVSNWGSVTSYGLFDRQYGGKPDCVVMLPEPVKVRVGTIPVIHNGRLLLGADVTAQIAMQSEKSADFEK